MRIIIRKQGELQGYELVCDENSTIVAVKKTYSTAFGIDDVSDLSLTHNGVELNDNKTLAECGIREDVILFLSSPLIKSRGQVKTLWSCVNLESFMHGALAALAGGLMYASACAKHTNLHKRLSSTTEGAPEFSLKGCITIAVPLFIVTTAMSALASYADKTRTP